MVLRVLILSIIALQSHTCYSQSSKKNAAIGSSLYEDSLYENSIEFYNESLKLEPNNDFLFNLANSHLKAGDLENAKKAYTQLLNSNSASNELKSKASYNLGNINYAEQDLEKSIINYKNALDWNPQDREASENLQIALAQLQQQQHQQQQQQEQQEQQQNSSEENQEQQDNPDQEEQDEPKGADSPSENSENEKKQSQSDRIDMDKAEEIMKYLDQKENNTRERLNNNEKKKGANKTKSKKDW